VAALTANVCAISATSFSGYSAASPVFDRTQRFVVNHNPVPVVAIQYRWADGRDEQLAAIAGELARLKVDVIVTHSTAPVVAAKQATAVIPIVFTSAADPVGNGLVASLSRPGGNVTGISSLTAERAGKRLELLRELIPSVHSLAIMTNADGPGAVLEMADAQAAARTLGLEIVTSEIRRAEDIAPAFEAFKGRGCTLCHSRPAGAHQLDSYQYLGGRRSTADGIRFARIRRSGRPNVIRRKLPQPIQARCRPR
jgi:hypothetical protein